MSIHSFLSHPDGSGSEEGPANNATTSLVHDKRISAQSYLVSLSNPLPQGD